MTLKSALERLSDLTDALERSYPDLIGDMVPAARQFILAKREAAAKGVATADLLPEVLELCRRLEEILDLCLIARSETTESIVA